MRFTNFIMALLPAASLVAAAPALTKRAMNATVMVENIHAITAQSRNLQPIISNIQFGVVVTGNPFQPAINGFQGIIQAATADITAMSGTVAFDDADAQLVCAAFADFVKVHQQLLKIVIGKSGLLQSFFLAPVAAVLRSLEAVVDTLAFGIIGAVPSCQAEAKKDLAKLDKTLGKAVCAYIPGGNLGGGVFCQAH